MPVVRGLSLSALVTFATAWAACIGVPGLWLLIDGPAVWPRFAASCTLGGSAAIAASTFVFLVVVVGRVLPALARRPEFWALEMLMFLAFILAGLASLLLALRTGSGGIA